MEPKKLKWWQRLCLNSQEFDDEKFVLKKKTKKKMMTQIICPKTQPKKYNDDKEFLMSPK